MYLRSLNGEDFNCITSVTRKRAVNGDKTIVFTLFDDVNHSAFLFDVMNEWSVFFKGEEYKILRIQESPKGRRTSRKFEAISAFQSYMRNKQVRTLQENKTLSINQALMTVFNGSIYTFNVIDSFPTVLFESFGQSSRLDLLQTVLTRYKAEYQVNGTVVTVRKLIGNDTDFQFRQAFNIKDVAREIDAADFSTYGEGFGKDGLHVTYTSPLADIFGILEAPDVRDERFTIANNLRDEVKKRIDESLKVSVSFDFQDMRKAGYPYTIPNEGDRVFLIHESMRLNLETRIVEIEEVFDIYENAIDTKVTLSNLGARDTYKAQLESAVKQMRDIFVTGSKKIQPDVLAPAIALATEALKSAQTELLFENGIVAVDKNNPNLLVLLNSAGIGISTNGGQTFDNAITAYGINTNLLTAGQINTNNIKIVGTEAYFMWDGNEFLAIDPNNVNKYVKITPGFLDISGGAIRIKRPDGFTVINNGMPMFDFSVDEASPPFLTNGVYQEGRWFKTKNTEKGECFSFSFRHTSRYLYLNLAFFADDGNSGYIYIDGAGALNGTNFYTFYTNHSIGNSYATVGRDFAIDLGVPTGGLNTVNVSIKSNAADKAISVRKIRAWMQE